MSQLAFKQFVRLMPNDYSSNPDTALKSLRDLALTMRQAHATESITERRQLLEAAVQDGEDFLTALLGLEGGPDVWQQVIEWTDAVECGLTECGYKVKERTKRPRKRALVLTSVLIAMFAPTAMDLATSFGDDGATASAPISAVVQPLRIHPDGCLSDVPTGGPPAPCLKESDLVNGPAVDS